VDHNIIQAKWTSILMTALRPGISAERAAIG
jgi:hypothetical protein